MNSVSFKLPNDTEQLKAEVIQLRDVVKKDEEKASMGDNWVLIGYDTSNPGPT